jgi:hypothetical protein
MMNPRMAVSALSMGVLLLAAGTAPADQGEKAKKDASLQLPITGTAAGGVTFTGTLSVQKFVVRDGQVAVVGIVRGTATSAAGVPLGTALVGPLTLPVQVGPGPTTAPTTAAPVAAQATCQVLHLDIGAVNLNVLGLVVATQPIGLDISGDSAGVLGNLVCTVLDTLNNVVDLVGLLNQILGLLTGLLGALIPG